MSHSKQYSRDRQREVRARVYPAHDYVKSTHCRACDNTYKREHKRRPKPVRLSEVSTMALRKELIRRAREGTGTARRAPTAELTEAIG